MTGISKGINRSSNYPERIKEGVEALFCDQKLDIAFKKEIGKVVYNSLLD